jgi:hypothetical protein
LPGGRGGTVVERRLGAPVAGVDVHCVDG